MHKYCLSTSFCWGKKKKNCQKKYHYCPRTALNLSDLLHYSKPRLPGTNTLNEAIIPGPADRARLQVSQMSLGMRASAEENIRVRGELARLVLLLMQDIQSQLRFSTTAVEAGCCY